MSDIVEQLQATNGGWYDDLAAGAIMEITRLREQLDQYKWRRVEDELPEEGDIVLSKGSHIVTVRAMYEAGKWWCCEDDDLYWITGVTHWMPILPLPNRESEE